MNIGTKISILRRMSKLSQPDLAFKLNISETTLSDIESCKTKKVDFLLIVKICDLFGVDFNYFLEDRKIKNVDKSELHNVNSKIETVDSNISEGILEGILRRIDLLEQSINKKFTSNI